VDTLNFINPELVFSFSHTCKVPAEAGHIFIFLYRKGSEEMRWVRRSREDGGDNENYQDINICLARFIKIPIGSSLQYPGGESFLI
jgi:hypothetical protein